MAAFSIYCENYCQISLTPFITALVTDVSIILIIGGCYGSVARVMAPCQAPSRSSGAVSPEQETAGALNSGHLIMPSSLLVLLSVAHNALLESCFCASASVVKKTTPGWPSTRDWLLMNCARWSVSNTPPCVHVAAVVLTPLAHITQHNTAQLDWSEPEPGPGIHFFTTLLLLAGGDWIGLQKITFLELL